MEEALSSANWNVIERGAHRLKGAVANFDAQRLFNAIVRLETDARSGRAAAISNTLVEVRAELSSFERELRLSFREEAA
jgi:HPt (histidine-containing phosphotransfer) domain-containing protein